MGNIKVMDENLANKIAAGEVVEKVASVVKELVENSIDAKSTNIKVEVVEAGTKRITVIDNGVGMDEVDAVNAFLPHATSKIKNENDLFFINTLGFRGEALPSIASVSEVELITTQNNTGTKVILKGGNLISKESYNFNQGTMITVSNLFYNTPARRKFLKSLNTELNNIIALIEKISLSHCNISFTLVSDGKIILKTSGSADALKTIHEIYGYNISKNMVYISGDNDDYEIKGYVSNINVNKSTKSHMITIVNGRVVSNPTINRIIKDAYHTFLAENKYPIVVINIETDPTLIDVNVHPTKQDIKFSKVETLEELLFDLVRNTLIKKDNIVKVTVPTREEIKETEKEYVQETIDFSIKEDTTNYEVNESLIEEVEEKLEKNIFIHPVGLAMGTYLFACDEENVYMIDIHAANERINYEKYLDNLKKEKVNKTDLLFPISIELSTSEYQTIMEYKSVLDNLGIDIEEFGINTLRITSHPTWIKEGYESESIKKIIDLVINYKGKFDRVKFNEMVAITLACKMSVKANTDITHMEQEILINRLFNCEFPYTCPHGRPTIIKYTKYELEKLFKRVV